MLNALDQHTMFYNANWLMMTGYALDCYHLLVEYSLMETVYPPLDRIMNDADYTAYLEKALSYMDQRCIDRGETVSNELALLAFLQPEVDRRARRSSYEKALCGILDEQEMSMEIDNIRDRLQGVSQLAHDMEQVSSRYMQSAIRRSEYFDDALALLKMKALSDDSLQAQTDFWNADALWADDDMPNAA